MKTLPNKGDGQKRPSLWELAEFGQLIPWAIVGVLVIMGVATMISSSLLPWETIKDAAAAQALMVERMNRVNLSQDTLAAKMDLLATKEELLSQQNAQLQTRLDDFIQLEHQKDNRDYRK